MSLDTAAKLVLAAASADALRARGADLSFRGFKEGLRAAMARDPLDTLVVTVVSGAYLFWLAERDANPKCRTYMDALVFVSTNLSVGFSHAYAVTRPGKAIAAALMTVGPAMAAAALQPPGGRAAAASPELLDVQHAIASKLDAILEELRSSRAA